MNWKSVGVAFLFLVIVFLGLLLFFQTKRVDWVRIQSQTLGDSIEVVWERVERSEDEVQRVKLEQAKLLEEISVQKEMVEKENSILLDRVDSLQVSVGDLLPPEIVDASVREQVEAKVQEIRDSYETQITNVTVLLSSTREALDKATERALLQEGISSDLREAYQRMEMDRNLWRGAAAPGWWDRLQKNASLVGGAVGAGIIIGALVSG